MPGNHESYTAAGQGTLDAWVAEFGQPYRFFDHKGTRFILLNSTLGTLRTSSWAQLPMLDEALRDAATNDAVDNVMVFAHHPVDDPGDPDASQLGDRTEVALIDELLTDFRERSGKGAASSAARADRRRAPDRGRALHGAAVLGQGALRDAGPRWVHGLDALERRPRGVGVPAVDRGRRARVRAVGDADRRDAVEVGERAQIEGSIVQPSGILPGTRVVPLRYPMSVRWSGSENVAIGDDPTAGKTAHFDPRTRKLTALRSGEVVLSATTDSMRRHRARVAGAGRGLEGDPDAGDARERGRAGRRHRAGHARADAGRAGVLRRVHPGRRPRVLGVHDRQRRLDRGRRGADDHRPGVGGHGPPGQRVLRAAAIAGRPGHREDLVGPDLQRAPSWSSSSSPSARATPCAPAPTARR